MSELEKRERERYRKNRQKRIVAMICALCASFFTFLVSLLSFVCVENNSYVEYSNKGSVIYKAYLADNDFYEQESLNGSHAYIAELIDYMTCDFHYELKLNKKANYRYTYKIEATLDIKDKQSSMSIYNPSYLLKEEIVESVSEENLYIDKYVKFDYHQYNQHASNLLNTYELTDVNSSLIVSMSVNVVGESEEFEDKIDEEYVISVSLPLLSKTVAPKVASSVPTITPKIRVGDTSAQELLKNIITIFATLVIILSISVYVYSIKTRDKHLEYSHKVKRIVSNYHSYIQRVKNDLSSIKGQYLEVSEFSELLEIRDTLQIPIVLFENSDKTMSKFYVVSEKIVYYFVIQVID